MDKLNRIFLMVLSALAVGTMLLQIPAVIDQRGLAADKQAVTDLESLQSAITTYSQVNNKLPHAVEDTELAGSVKDRLSRYEYVPAGGSYKLCATFHTDTSKSGAKSSTGSGASLSSSYLSYLDFSVHGKGHQCFTKTSSIDIYNYDKYLNNYNSNIDDSSGANPPLNSL